MSEEQKQEEIKEEIVEEQVEQKEDDRPEQNYRAELERKTRELERMRQELAMRQQEPLKRDPNDISTWSDHELKAILNSNDPSVIPYKERANDVLLDRKVDARLARERETSKRVTAEMQLRQQFPEALDPSSELAVKMDQIMTENDLSKTPAGRLVAAKLAAAELKQDKNSSDARGRKIEQDRVSRVKGQMVDGDRSKPTDNDGNLDNKRKELADKLMDSKHEENQVDAVGQILKDRGLTKESFFKRS